MDAVPSSPQPPHDVETCACPACQYFRYQRQYGPVPGPTIAPAPPNYALPPGAGPGNAGYYNPPGPGSTTPPPPPGWFPPAGYPPPAAGAGAGSDRTVASLAHWLPLVVALVLSFVIGAYAVFLCFIPPLIVMMTSKSAFTGEHARESLDFQLNVLIPGAVILVLSMASPPFGALLRLALFVSCLIIQIMAAVKASQGERYRYPVGIRFISPSRLRRAGP